MRQNSCLERNVSYVTLLFGSIGALNTYYVVTTSFVI